MEGGGAEEEEARAVEELRQALVARDLLPPKFDDKHTMRRYAVVAPCRFCLFLILSRFGSIFFKKAQILKGCCVCFGVSHQAFLWRPFIAFPSRRIIH